MKINFEEIKLQKVIKGICLKCGKKRSVIINAAETINPFNVKNGKQKTRQEVIESVQTNLPLLVKRYQDKFICKSCYNNLNFLRGDKWFEETEYDYLKGGK